jgi:hypothetical protein
VSTAETEKSAEIHVPILTDVNESIHASTVNAVSSNTRNRPIVAAVSVTRPPAPRPVELPTPHDIVLTSSPPESIDSYHSSFEVDLESGQRQGMREVSRDDANLVSSAKRSKNLPFIPLEDTTPVAVSSSPPPTSSPHDVRRSSPAIDPPDLLIDSTPVLDAGPPSPKSTHPEDSAPHPEAVAEDVSNASSQEYSIEPVISEDEIDVDTTVRLVGGGGIAGTAPVVEEEEATRTDDTDAASITSLTSESEVSKGKKKHKKTKSGLASLKKLGHLGGLRKRDSNNSMKVAAPPAPTAV